LGFGVWGLGLGVWGWGFRVWGLGFSGWGQGVGFGVEGLWVRGQGSGWLKRTERVAREYFAQTPGYNDATR